MPIVIVFGGGAFVGWWGHKNVAVMNGLVPLWRDPRQVPYPFHLVRTQQENSHVWTRKWARAQTLNLLVSWTPPSRTLGNKCLLFINTSLWYFVIVTEWIEAAHSIHNCNNLSHKKHIYLPWIKMKDILAFHSGNKLLDHKACTTISVSFCKHASISLETSLFSKYIHTRC